MDLIKKLRDNYRPKNGPIKYLLIAESPPKCDDKNVRFFYNPNKENYDYLFKSIMDIVFPSFIKDYRKGDKDKYLKKFQEKGFYLIDATDIPVNRLSTKKRNEMIRNGMKSKIKEIENLIDKNTPIFLIKKNVYDIFKEELKNLGYNVAQDDFLPFPCCGHQKKFKEKFGYYLSKVYS